MSLSGVASIDAALRAGQFDDYYAEQTVNTNAGQWCSTWQTASSTQFPAKGVAPSSGGTTYNGATAGALNFNNVSPSKRFLYSFGVGNASGMAGPFCIMIYDRLVGVGSVSVASASGAQTVNTPNLPRYTSGVGVQAWLEFTTVTNGNITLSASYTNQSGSSGQTTPSQVTPTQSQNFCAVQLNIAPGDTGFQSVQSVTVSSTTGTAGVCSVILLKPLVCLAIPGIGATATQPGQIEQNYVLGNLVMPRIFDGANLAFLTNGNSSSNWLGNIRTVWG
ncbi:MAG: hypothetical protein KGL39_29230 [Patescibacteria group bacterium]|nr:hypothetical protein [Patescibacteria group bacterium]